MGVGTVVTKDVPPFHVLAGNPTRIIRKIETTMSRESSLSGIGKRPSPSHFDGDTARSRLCKSVLSQYHYPVAFIRSTCRKNVYPGDAGPLDPEKPVGERP